MFALYSLRGLGRLGMNWIYTWMLWGDLGSRLVMAAFTGLRTAVRVGAKLTYLVD